MPASTTKSSRTKVMEPKHSELPRLDGQGENPGAAANQKRTVPAAMIALLALFVFLECLFPLSTAIQIGGDEGFELAKATACLNGQHLYSEVWNDQPPLHTFLITEMLRHVSPSILGPRLMTIFFALILLGAVFILIHRIHGLPAAIIATALLIGSPGFLELSASCMLELPAFALAAAGLCLLVEAPASRFRVREVVAGALFGLALLIKTVPLMLLPLVVFILWCNDRRVGRGDRNAGLDQRPLGEGTRTMCSGKAACCKPLLKAGGVVIVAAVFSFVFADLLIERGAYLAHFRQSFASHFAPARSFEYGSASDYPFDWAVLLKNWDTLIPAVLGVWFCARAARTEAEAKREGIDGSPIAGGPASVLPALWLGWSLLVFGVHRPWWPYYYVHTAIPLCWCAGIGFAGLFASKEHRGRKEKSDRGSGRTRPGATGVKVSWSRFVSGRYAAAFLFATCAAVWVGGRVYLQIAHVRNSPQTYDTLVLEDLARFKPYAKYLYTDQPIFSFYSGIPMPPDLAVVMLKRFWSGEMTNTRLAGELRTIKPGLILMRNNGLPLPFDDLLRSDYRLVYEDPAERLYAHRTISRKP